jgi:BirA family biotin operon repressor/biotin-[acetyl-CoA-carboxylase] ligase
VIAVAFLRTLKAMNIDADIGLKWPNDVQWQGKKLAGILIDLHGESHYSCDAVIGIGVNLDQPYELKQAAGVAMTDIAEIIHAKPARNQLIACLLASLFDAIDEFKKTGLASFFDEWVAHDVALNQPVNLVFGEKIIHGIYRGIDPVRGELLLQDEQGVIQQYSGGEVSLRINRI